MGLSNGEYLNLFEDLGEIVQAATTFYAQQATIAARLDAIRAEYQANSMMTLYSGTPEVFEGFHRDIVSWTGQLKSLATKRLLDRETILVKLPVGNSTDLNTVFVEMMRDMVDTARSVAKNTVTIGAVTADKLNGTAGTCVTGKVLDGVTSAHSGFIAYPELVGIDSEVGFNNDDISITCVSSSSTGSTAEGAEQWIIKGCPSAGSFYSQKSHSSGDGPLLVTLQGNTILQNTGFDNWNVVTNIPVGWAINAGTAGVHILRENTPGSYHTGTAALKLRGDGVVTDINISQAPAPGVLQPGKRYLFAAFIDSDMVGGNTGALTIQFEGTGYTAAGTEKVDLNAAALIALSAYTLHTFYINMPTVIPADMKLAVKFTGTPTNGKSVWVDTMGFGPVTYHGGVHMAIIQGAGRFVTGDRFTFNVSNNQAGVFQTFFRNNYGLQLPSNAVPTIADALATD